MWFLALTEAKHIVVVVITNFIVIVTERLLSVTTDRHIAPYCLAASQFGLLMPRLRLGTPL
jgi:hypothetical protein